MPPFGAELQRRRLDAGMSLGELSRRVYYSKSHLSKIENGHKGVGIELARACDSALEAGGALIALVPTPAVAAGAGVDAYADQRTWRLDLRPDGSSTAWLGDARMRLPVPTVVGSAAAAEGVFAAIRVWGRDASPSAVLPALLGQLQTVRAAVNAAGGATRTEHLALGARMTEFAGWMAQEAGDTGHARYFTDLAEHLAAQAGLSQMEHHVPVRRALLAMYDGDAEQTIELAARARSTSGASPRLRSLAALREAQGYALAGDLAGFRRTLDLARDFAVRAAGEQDGPLGPGASLDVHTAVTEGWGLYDLGRYPAAIEILDRQVPLLRGESARSYARFAARRVLAHVAAGDPDRAADLLPDLLDYAERADSATVRADLHALSRLMLRWPDHPRLTPLRPRLTALLSAHARQDG